MSDKRLPPGRAIELIVPVVKALARAHEANIVHRDLKPDNIIVNLGGTVKVLDFGIAKLFAEDDASAPRPRGANAGDGVRGGGILGTLPYMSPEQLGTDDVDHRSDLWAVGIILFEMLAGKHPLDPLTQGKLFGAAASDEPMPSLARCGRRGYRTGSSRSSSAASRRPRPTRYADRRRAPRGARAVVAVSHRPPPRRPTRARIPGSTRSRRADANRFFGRSQDIAGTVTRLREQPMIAVVGPSGAGKSSFVRAGVVPALKASGDAWECLIVRPGRQPLAALASTLEQLREIAGRRTRHRTAICAQRLRREPGVLGARLRARARKRRTPDRAVRRPARGALHARARSPTSAARSPRVSPARPTIRRARCA